MKYITEAGIILAQNRDILTIVDGEPGHVVFPRDLIWSLHMQNKGCIYALVHTHPPGMTNLSHEDETTLKALCQALYPFPLRLMTVTAINDQEYQTTIYLGLLQSKEDWISKGKQGERKFEILTEDLNVFWRPQGSLWEQTIIAKSYDIDNS